MTISGSAAFDSGESPQSVYSAMFESEKDPSAAALNSQEDMSEGEDVVSLDRVTSEVRQEHTS